jgi:hypothetical protein
MQIRRKTATRSQSCFWTSTKYSLPLIHSGFLLKFLDGVGPLNRFRCLVVVGDEIQDGLLQGSHAFRVGQLQELSLQDAEPDLDLVPSQEAFLGSQ